MIISELTRRNLPPLQSRQKMLEILQQDVYGMMPPEPENMTFLKEETATAELQRVTVSGSVNGNPFSFPFYLALPETVGPHPFFVHINFNACMTDQETPFRLLTEAGYGVLSFYYQDVTADNDDFSDGIAAAFCPDGKRHREDAPGKIALWAWAARRVLDYAMTRQDLFQTDKATVCGHSRLGKTALLAAAYDDRFACVYSNESGCSGAALSRGKEGEHIADICDRFPYWFCERYQYYMGREAETPFDQHYLVASAAPRKVLIGSASEDAWADPVSEFLCCVAAGRAFPKGFCCGDRLPQVGDRYLTGDIGYHLRAGEHDFSLEDWQVLLQFLEKKRGE